MMKPSEESIMDYVRVSDRIGTSGQPTEAQLRGLADAGYEVVINLRPVGDAIPSEKGLVEEQELEYLHIPVVWEAPTMENVTEFFTAMDSRAGKRIFVHCARNMRVSAFIYLYRVVRERETSEEALSDLHRIWTPNPTWQRLIDRVLAGSPGALTV